MSEISVVVNGSTTINPTVGNGDTVNVTIAPSGERGPSGTQGVAGPANTLSIGTVTQGTAAATISGTSPNQILNLVLQKGDDGTPATNIELQATGTHIQWRLVGASTWNNLVALSAITGPTGSAGANGAAVELQASGTHIQWRYVGGSTWTNIVALSSLVGATGATGATGAQGPEGPPINLADETPQPLGAASAGTALTAARADHVHAVGSITYSSLSGIPSTFAPSAHTHAVSDVTGLQTALDGKQASGAYATLVGGTIPSSQLPSYVDDVIDVGGTLPATGDVGKIYVVSTGANTNKIYRWSGSAFVEISPSPGSTDSVTEGSVNLYHTTARAAAAAPVQSVAGRTGTVTLAKADVGLGNVPNTDATARSSHTGTQTAATISDFATEAAKYGPVASVAGRTGTVTLAKADVGLGNVDNTSDAGKPVSTATQTALDGKAATSHTHSLSDISQSSATTGQVPTWNGSAWTAATPSGGGGGGSYTLPTATSSVLGGIKVGSGLTITDGVLSATGGGGGEDARWEYFKPAAPTSVTAVAGNAQAVVSWTASTTLVPLLTDYSVQYSTDSGSTWTTATDAVSAATSATITSLTNDTAVQFRVAGINGIGTGAYSTASAAVTPTARDPLFSSVALLLPMNGTGSAFVDSSGTPKTITAVGATQSATHSKWGGKSAFFNGTGHYLEIPGVSIGTGDFAIEMWFKTNSGVQYAQLLGNESGSSSGFSLLINNDEPSGGQIALYRGGLIVSTSSGDWSDDQWHYLALSRSGTTVRLYLDGTLASQGSSSASLSSPASMYVGYNNQFPPRNVVGYIDDLRITVGSARGMTGSTVAVPVEAFPTS
jgi:hypothetical protein